MTDQHREVTPEQACIAYKNALATEDGQVVLADLLRHFGYVYSSTFEPGDPQLSAMREGQRMVMVHIGKMLAIDPAQLKDSGKAEM